MVKSVIALINDVLQHPAADLYGVCGRGGGGGGGGGGCAILFFWQDLDFLKCKTGGQFYFM